MKSDEVLLRLRLSRLYYKATCSSYHMRIGRCCITLYISKTCFFRSSRNSEAKDSEFLEKPEQTYSTLKWSHLSSNTIWLCLYDNIFEEVRTSWSLLQTNWVEILKFPHQKLKIMHLSKLILVVFLQSGWHIIYLFVKL